MERKNVILLTVIAVATLLITVVGATFAFYTANINNDANKEISVKSVDVTGLNITYNDGDKIEAKNVIPGWGITYDVGKHKKTIEVKNETEYSITYTLKWGSVSNDFDTNDKKNLQFTSTAKVALVDGGDASGSSATPVQGGQCPNTGETTEFVTQTLKPGEKATYEVDITYADSNENQDLSQGKTFTGKIVLNDDDVKVNYTATD